MDAIRWIGRISILFLESLGFFSIFLLKSTRGVFRGTWSRVELSKQLERVGVSSILVVSITSAFTGMVMAVQTIDQFVRFGATNYIGGVIGLSMVREMSPVLTGLVVTGRVGAAMAAEISSMRITEQLDALRAFGLDDVAFVGSPRLFASFVMLPILTIYSFVIGIGGGYLFVVTRGIHGSVFLKSLEALLEPSDIFGGILKAAVFGIIISTTACAEGFRARNGAIGVGEATTRAVVWSNMLILTFNYILSTLLFGGAR
jgi:phospholipid/cholesterol/gamma-HCH transport system permease protein